MNKHFSKTIVALVLLATSLLLHAADVTIAPPVGGGFVVKDATGTQDRMRVQETGAVSIPQLTNAASADTTLCFDAATGRLGPCSASPITRQLQGTIQKGPYIFGSSVWISELDQSLNQNGKSYIVQTNSDFGNFDGPTITVNNVEMLGDGYYMDELSGGLSVGRLQLRAIVDLSIDAHPIINILTTIQTPRLKFLLKSGMAYAAAYSQSQREVITAFGINPSTIVGLGTLSQMNISGSTDQDAVLLSASVVLLKMAANSVVANPSSSSTAELSRLVSVIARDLEKDGVLNDTTIIAARRTANMQINLPQVRTNVESYYAGIGQTMTAPKFEEWVDVDGSGVLPRRILPFPGLLFTDLTGVEPNQIFTSNTVTVSGFGAGVGAPVTVSAGTTVIKNGSAVSGTSLTAVDGDTLALRVTSLGYGLTKSAPISVGSASTTWHVATKSLGGTITGLTSAGLVLQNNGGDNITIAASSTSFTFPATIANGASYSVSVLTQPTTPLQVCTVTNGDGTAGAALSNISVKCVTQAGYAYVIRPPSNSIVTYGIDPTNGALSPVGTVTTGTYPYSIAIDPNGKFAYLVNLGATNQAGPSSIQTYSINAGSGALVSVSTKLTGTDAATRISVDPTGKFAYVADNNDLLAFSIDITSGAFTSIGTYGSNASGSNPAAVAVDPAGKFVYVANFNFNNVLAYSIDATTGALTKIGAFAAGSIPGAISIDPTGKFAYVTNQSSNNISAYTINVTTGALTSIGTFATGASPQSIAIDPTGKFAYVTNWNAGGVLGAVAAYAIDATTGALTSIGTFATEYGSNYVVVDPTGKFAYVGNSGSGSFQSNNVSVYTINAATGALTSIGAFAAGTSAATSIAIKSVP